MSRSRPQRVEDSDDEEILGSSLEEINLKHVKKGGSMGGAGKVWEQVVTDEQGRQRFHGAFTGGFSAGYFNTVGTKEGWAPKTFTSSRESRFAGRGQRPEDFMDDEDINSGLAAGKTLTTRNDFSQSRLTDNKQSKSARQQPSFMDTESFGFGTAAELQSRGKRPRDTGESATSRPNMNLVRPEGQTPINAMSTLSSMIEPSHDTIGLRLLKKMGWSKGRTHRLRKPPSLSAFAADANGSGQETKTNIVSPSVKKIYGVAMPPPGTGISIGHDDEDEQVEEDDILHTIMNTHARIYNVKEKNDLYGFGFDPSKDAPEFHSLNAQQQERAAYLKAKAAKKSGGFGVGADQEEDDDVYDDDDMPSKQSKMQIYDFEIGGETKVKNSRVQAVSNKEKLSFQRAVGKPVQVVHFTNLKVPASFEKEARNHMHRFNVALPTSLLSQQETQQMVRDINLGIDSNVPGEKRGMSLAMDFLTKITNFGNMSGLYRNAVEEPAFVGLNRNRTDMSMHEQRGQLLGETPLPSRPKPNSSTASNTYEVAVAQRHTALQQQQQQQIQQRSNAPVALNIGGLSTALDSMFSVGGTQNFQQEESAGLKDMKAEMAAKEQEIQKRQDRRKQQADLIAMQYPMDQRKALRLNNFVKQLRNMTQLHLDVGTGDVDFYAIEYQGPGLFQLTDYQKREEKLEFNELCKRVNIDTKSLWLNFENDSEMEGLNKQKVMTDLELVPQVPKDKVVDKVVAAKLKMFGPLTRTVKPWLPDKLLCKRFGLPQPSVSFPSSSSQAAPSSASTSSTDGGVNVFDRRHDAMMQTLIGSQYKTPASAQLQPINLSNVSFSERQLALKKKQEMEQSQLESKMQGSIGEETGKSHSNTLFVPPSQTKKKTGVTVQDLVDRVEDDKSITVLAAEEAKEKPCMDLFKAIFEASDDESDDDSSKKTEPDVKDSDAKNNNINTNSSINIPLASFVDPRLPQSSSSSSNVSNSRLVKEFSNPSTSNLSSNVKIGVIESKEQLYHPNEKDKSKERDSHHRRESSDRDRDKDRHSRYQNSRHRDEDNDKHRSRSREKDRRSTENKQHINRARMAMIEGHEKHGSHDKRSRDKDERDNRHDFDRDRSSREYRDRDRDRDRDRRDDHRRVDAKDSKNNSTAKDKAKEEAELRALLFKNKRESVKTEELLPYTSETKGKAAMNMDYYGNESRDFTPQVKVTEQEKNLSMLRALSAAFKDNDHKEKKDNKKKKKKDGKKHKKKGEKKQKSKSDKGKGKKRDDAITLSSDSSDSD